MTTLVLFHGFLGGPSHFDRALERLGSRAEVVIPELPGHGLAAAPPFPAGWTDTVRSLAAAVPPGALLGGYSLGARLALAVAAERTDLAGLLLVSVHPGLTEEAARRERRSADLDKVKMLQCGGLEAFADAWGAEPIVRLFTADEDTRQARAAARRQHRANGIAWSLRALGLAEMPPLAATLRDRPYPVHLVTGDRDPKFTALAVSAAGTIAVHHRVAHAGHDVVSDAPEAIARVLDEMISHDRSSPAPTASRRVGALKGTTP